MAELVLDPAIADPDAFYEQLITLHAGRAVEESMRINARLILILANHIGDAKVLTEAIALAGQR